jgi:N-acetylglutamate synthase
MVSWPELGTRVTVRYRRRPGSIPPLTDAVGHLLAVDPVVRVQTKTGSVVECAPADVVALRTLTDAPVRTSEIRALEQAAAESLGGEQIWLDGWLLQADSAVPLDISAHVDAIPAIASWYTDRGLTPRLLIPDRLLPAPAGLKAEREERILVRDDPPGDYVCVDERDTDAIAHAESQGFRLHHRRRYFKLDSL